MDFVKKRSETNELLELMIVCVSDGLCKEREWNNELLELILKEVSIQIVHLTALGKDLKRMTH